MKRRRIVVVGLSLAFAALAAGAVIVRAQQATPSGGGRASGVRAPEGVRIRVQVINATKVRGLARRATQYLRARGFDVVEMGTAKVQRDSTVVLDRSGHADWAGLVGKVIGAPVQTRPDSSRYLDVTVVLGASWRPPAEAFNP